MANIDEILAYARNQGCSDVHIGEDTGVTLRLDGQLVPYIQEYNNEEITQRFFQCVKNVYWILLKHTKMLILFMSTMKEDIV